MARVSNPLIGKSRNKIGGVVFSTWKGINTLREKPATVANPRTPAQQAQRSAFTQMVAMGRAILGAIQIAFRQRAVQMSEFNAFMRLNLDEAFTVAGAVATFDASRLLAASGTLVPIADFQKDALTGRALDLLWDDNSGSSGANNSDLLYVTVVSADGLNIVNLATGAARDTGAGSVAIPGAWSLVGARAAGYYVSADLAQSSNSVNIAL